MRDIPLQRHREIATDIDRLPQLIPHGVCQTCSVCCRFPQADSFLRPHFTADEIRGAVASGLSPDVFSDKTGCQISLVPNPTGEGYVCPAFNQQTSECRIYGARPFDCQVYPMAIMWSEDDREVVLGWDTKCPFVVPGLGRGGAVPSGGTPQELTHYAKTIADLVEQDAMVARFAANPGLVARYQHDVSVLRSLPKLTEQLVPVVRGGLRSLSITDRPIMEAALATSGATLSCYAFAPQFVWGGLYAYSWREMADRFCLFAWSPDGLFMPLPPLGAGSLKDAAAQAFSLMQHRNGHSPVSRVEGVSEEAKLEWESLGYRLSAKDGDYLYRVGDLVSLAGDRYKSQRNACNQFLRNQFQVDQYQPGHREACLVLYRRWVAQQDSRETLDQVAKQMLEDSGSAHARALLHAEDLGLTGLVVLIEGSLCAYTLGYELPTMNRTADVFCVLFEVADRSIPGLAQFTFRECCRRAAERGYQWINTMDDSGLPFLARSKAAYHPVRIVPSYIATLPT